MGPNGVHFKRGSTVETSTCTHTHTLFTYRDGAEGAGSASLERPGECLRQSHVPGVLVVLVNRNNSIH